MYDVLNPHTPLAHTCRPGPGRRLGSSVPPAIEVGHSYVAHRDCHPDSVTSLGPTWATATGWDTVEDWVGARLSSRWGAAEGADFDQEGLCAEVRQVVNDNLPAGWTLDENQFAGPTPIAEDALASIRDIIDEIDFWGMAQYYDNGD
jgi:hypothetical protein